MFKFIQQFSVLVQEILFPSSNESKNCEISLRVPSRPDPAAVLEVTTELFIYLSFNLYLIIQPRLFVSRTGHV